MCVAPVEVQTVWVIQYTPPWVPQQKKRIEKVARASRRESRARCACHNQTLNRNCLLDDYSRQNLNWNLISLHNKFKRSSQLRVVLLRAESVRGREKDAGRSTTMPHNLFNSLQTFTPSTGKTGELYSLPNSKKKESRRFLVCCQYSASCLNRCCAILTAERITEDDVRSVANWQPNAERTEEFHSWWRACCFRTSRASRFWLIWRRCGPRSCV